MRRTLLATTVLLLAGCALLLGKPYEPLRTIPDGMGVIYIYDAGAGLGSRVFIDPDLTSPSAKHYLVLAPDGYYPYLTSEGAVRVFDDTEGNPFGCVELQVSKARPHWVRVTERGDVLEVKSVPETEAVGSLGAHKRISRDALGDSSGVATPRDCEGGTESEVAPPRPASTKETEGSEGNEEGEENEESEESDESDESEEESTDAIELL